MAEFYFCLDCSCFFQDKEGTIEKRVLSISEEEEAQIPVSVITCTRCRKRHLEKRQKNQAATS